MPEMDGVEAIRRIMAKSPCAIVVVTGSVNRHCSKVFEALGAGALDAVQYTDSRTGYANMLAPYAAGKDPDHQPADREQVADKEHGPGSAAAACATAPANAICSSLAHPAGGPSAVPLISVEIARRFFGGHRRYPTCVDSQFADGLAEWLRLPDSPARAPCARGRSSATRHRHAPRWHA